MPQAGETEFQAWEKLIDQGVGRYDAAVQAGTTLRRLKNGDLERFEEGVTLSLERQAAKAEKLISTQVRRDDPPPQLVALELKAHHPDYADKTQLELSGKVEHEHHGRFSIANLIAIAGARGLLDDNGDRPLPGLPAAREILPGPSE